MGESTKNSEQEEERKIEAEIKAEEEAAKKAAKKPESFGIKEAEKLASSYIPKGKEGRYSIEEKDGVEVTTDNFDVMYVTSDKNVFFKNKEGQARNHANKFKLELFTVKPVKK